MLIGFICEKHGYINVESHGQRICPHCQQDKAGARLQAPYLNLVSPEIDKQCKAEGSVVLKPDEAQREAARNKQYNNEKRRHEISKRFQNGIK